MKNILLAILFSVLTISCLEENIQPVNIPFNNSLDVLNYAETNGNYINSDENPSLINVDEVYNNLSTDLLLDIRQPSDYSSAHIEGAKNIDPNNLIEFLDTANIAIYKKIIIISNSGQKAAYITSLLRIVGYQNIFSLDYGLGYWNEIFADLWLSNKKNSKYINTYYRLGWENKEGLKINYSTPNLVFKDPTKSIKEKIKERIRDLISNYSFNSVLSIDQFDDMFSDIPYFFGYGNRFILCYDHELRRGRNPTPPILYNAHNIYPQAVPPFNSPILYYESKESRIVRPLGTYLYNGQDPEYDFRSDALLFTIPNDREIIIYSYNGQRSAYITAYLNLLGYDAKFVLFGAHSMMSKYYISWEISGLVARNNLDTTYYRSELGKYAFFKDNIRNYPYVTGQ